ncbi:VOC family protein [Candidatus Poribacteria bacterium]|nr:VOC family protein [Candidatus Poribacteria bacterium]
MSNPVPHFEIGGKDIDKLIEFYSEVFDWQITPLVDELYIADPHSKIGIQGHLFQIDNNEDFDNLVLIYITVNDIFETLKSVEQLGGEIIIKPQEIPGNASHYALFNDRSGNSIGLLQTRL